MPSADPSERDGLDADGSGLADAAGPSLLDVDIGGTFTDAFVVLGGRQATGKSLTTHADLSDGMIAAIGEAARRLGCEPSDAFAAADAVKYSTTVGTNALIERTGPRVGLITTAGQEDTIHVARSRSWPTACHWRCRSTERGPSGPTIWCPGRCEWECASASTVSARC